jgi:anhydro-N-acetylmuramic acid kinase
VTVLANSTDDVIGFDTGPGNTLLDEWISEKQSNAFDDRGAWAASGKVIQPLLLAMLDDPYFALQPPKSTGLEYFNLRWLSNVIQQCSLSKQTLDNDVQATLAAFTAKSISQAIGRYAPNTSTVMVCGGGVHNDDLMSRLNDSLPAVSISSTGDFGLDPDWVEAAAFAWLAMRTLDKLPGNLPSVTGATRNAILGSVHFGTR